LIRENLAEAFLQKKVDEDENKTTQHKTPGTFNGWKLFFCAKSRRTTPVPEGIRN